MNRCNYAYVHSPNTQGQQVIRDNRKLKALGILEDLAGQGQAQDA